MKLKEVLLGLVCVFAAPLILVAVALILLFLDFRERQEVKGNGEKESKKS